MQFGQPVIPLEYPDVHFTGQENLTGQFLGTDAEIKTEANALNYKKHLDIKNNNDNNQLYFIRVNTYSIHKSST